MTTESSDNDRRLKRISVSDEILSQLFRQGTEVVRGLPDDARFVRFTGNPKSPKLVKELVFRSDEFEPVMEGGQIPPVEEFALSRPQDEDQTLEGYERP